MAEYMSPEQRAEAMVTVHRDGDHHDVRLHRSGDGSLYALVSCGDTGDVAELLAELLRDLLAQEIADVERAAYALAASVCAATEPVHDEHGRAWGTRRKTGRECITALRELAAGVARG